MTCLVSVLFGVGTSVLLSISFDNSLRLEKQNACNVYKMVLGSLKLISTVKESPDFTDVIYALDSFSAGGVDAWDAMRLYAQDEILYTHGQAPFKTYSQTHLVDQLVVSYLEDGEGRYYLQLSTSFSAGSTMVVLDAAYEKSMEELEAIK